MEEENIKENTENTENSKLLSEIIHWLGIVLFAFILANFINRVVILNAIVPSGSMEDTIRIDDRLIGGRFAYWFAEPKRGDVVIFKYPVDESRNYIKRVIGLPGEHIDIVDGKVYIDGSDEPLEEDYLREEWTNRADGLSYDVPEGCYFMMGDNRNNSADSRYWAEEAYLGGLVSSMDEAAEYTYVRRDKILAKAYFIYWNHFKVIK